MELDLWRASGFTDLCLDNEVQDTGWKKFNLSTMLLLAVLLIFSQAGFAGPSPVLPEFLSGLKPHEVFPGADRLGSAEGSPPVAIAYKGDQQLGYVFINSDYVNSTGYSGKPIHMVVGMDMQAVIQKVVLVEHHEPIVLIGIPEKRIVAVLDTYMGMNIRGFAIGEAEDHQVDIVSGATVTVMVMDDTIIRSAIKVARAYGLAGLTAEIKSSGPELELRMGLDKQVDWIDLISDGSVRRLKLSIGEVNQAYEDSGNIPAADRPEQGEPDEVFIELYAGLVTAPSIGRSMLGENEYQNMLKVLKPGQQAVMLAGKGRFSFKGSGYVRGGIFDRFQLIQGDISIRFHDRMQKRLRRVEAEGAPDFIDTDLFLIPHDIGFDPAKPWKLELLVGRAIGPIKKAFITFDLDYTLPGKYLQPKASSAEASSTQATEGGSTANKAETNAKKVPLWQKMWLSKLPEIAVLSVALGVLTIIFFFQNSLAKHPVLTDRVRMGFLVFTLFGIGWYANAQLSVVNILTVFNALATGFSWEYFLMDPLIFILWSSVAASLLLWGRGPFCGWLCPFGALQELLNRIAKLFKVPQFELPWGLHERLWALKYIIFLVLFGFSLHSLGWAERLAEVEPFKTSIILKFAREWPFVLFAAALLIAGLFIERFYCRYICPLGAALAIPGRLRIFEWLRRYDDCGSKCQRCRHDCMVGAIHPEGNINSNECLYCLHCQVMYYDSHECPVMIKKRVKRERQEARASGTSKDDLAQVINQIKLSNQTNEEKK